MVSANGKGVSKRHVGFEAWKGTVLLWLPHRKGVREIFIGCKYHISLLSKTVF